MQGNHRLSLSDENPGSALQLGIQQLRAEFVRIIGNVSNDASFDALALTPESLRAAWQGFDPQRVVHGSAILVEAVSQWLRSAEGETAEPATHMESAEDASSLIVPQMQPPTSPFNWALDWDRRASAALAAARRLSVLDADAALHRRLLSQQRDSVMSQACRLPVQFTRTLRNSISAIDERESLNQYVILDEIGSGTEANVMIAFDTEKQEYRAIKVLRRAFRTFGKARQREVAAMKKLRHKNVVALYEVIDDPKLRKLYLVLQFAEKGPLSKTYEEEGELLCDPIPPGKLEQYARQICSGLAYLHAHGIVHRDIKPDNILLGSDDCVYISDLGVAEVFRDDDDEEDDDDEDKNAESQSSTKSSPRLRRMVSSRCVRCGTPAFFAPELLDESADDTQTNEVDSKPLDVWALGVTFFMLFTGRHPWSQLSCSSRSSELSRRIVHDTVEYPPSMPLPWQSLLSGMLAKNPAERMHLTEVRCNVKKMIVASVMANSVSVHRGSVPLNREDLDTALTEIHPPGTARAGNPRSRLTEGRPDGNPNITDIAISPVDVNLPEPQSTAIAGKPPPSPSAAPPSKPRMKRQETDKPQCDAAVDARPDGASKDLQLTEEHSGHARAPVVTIAVPHPPAEPNGPRPRSPATRCAAVQISTSMATLPTQ